MSAPKNWCLVPSPSFFPPTAANEVTDILFSIKIVAAPTLFDMTSHLRQKFFPLFFAKPPELYHISGYTALRHLK